MILSIFISIQVALRQNNLKIKVQTQKYHFFISSLKYRVIAMKELK